MILFKLKTSHALRIWWFSHYHFNNALFQEIIHKWVAYRKLVGCGPVSYSRVFMNQGCRKFSSCSLIASLAEWSTDKSSPFLKALVP